MDHGEVSTTNIFCLLGKPGCGRNTILKRVLDDVLFLDKANMFKLVFGTTRPIKVNDIEGETYHFFTKEQYLNLDPKTIIESRSYDPMFNEEYYYFTLTSHIRFGSSYICKASVFQYAEYKKYANTIQLQMPMVRMNIYPIIINAPIFEREKRLMSLAAVDKDVYDICIKLLQEKYEFETVINENPEIIDSMNPNTLVIDNGKNDIRNVALAADKIKKFINEKIAMQGK